MQLLPAISDSQDSLDNFYETFSTAGANYVLPASLTLFGESASSSKTLTLRRIEKFFPEKVSTYKEVFRYGFKPAAKYISDLNNRIRLARAKHPLNDRIISIT